MNRGGFEIEFDTRDLFKYYDDVHNAAVNKAVSSSINRTLSKLRTRIKRRISQSTGVPQKNITQFMKVRKAGGPRPQGSISISGRTPNAIHFNAKEQKKALSHRSFRKTIKTKTGFIAKGKALRRKPNSKRLPVRPVYGPNIARAFGAPKNMVVYKRFARNVLRNEYNARLEFFLSRVKRRRN